jgi:hypothetical protein
MIINILRCTAEAKYFVAFKVQYNFSKKNVQKLALRTNLLYFYVMVKMNSFNTTFYTIEKKTFVFFGNQHYAVKFASPFTNELNN